METKHLTFWQEDITFEQARKWLDSPLSLSKNYVAQYIKEKKNFESLLDAGAGTCSLHKDLVAREIDIKYTATEITERFVKIGKLNNLEIHECPIQKMPFSDNSFDIVACIDVMTHQKEFKDSITEMVRVAKKEVLISFFKPFLEQQKAQLELQRSAPEFKIEEIPNVGMCVERHDKFVYTYFSGWHVENFLIENDYKHKFFQIPDGTVFLSIKKDS